MRRYLPVALLLGSALAACGALWRAWSEPGNGPRSAAAQPAGEGFTNQPRLQGPAAPAIDPAEWPDVSSVTVRLQFGRTDSEPIAWDGTALAQGAALLRIRPWRFDGGMRVAAEGHAWQCGTWLGPVPRVRDFEMHLPPVPQSLVHPGVLIDLQAQLPGPVQLHVDTAQGEFVVDVAELARQGAAQYLDGRVTADLAVYGYPVAARRQPDELSWHDYPSIATSPLVSDALAVCWQTYAPLAGGDTIYVRMRTAEGWQPPQQIAVPGDYYRTAMQYDGDGSLWIVYAAQVSGNWDLFASRLVEGAWQNFRLTDDAQPDIHHVLVRDSGGALWLVWQAFRNGRSDIHARRWDGLAWSEAMRVSQSPANDWEPSATACQGGGIAVAWDSYDQGNYDVFCRLLRWPQEGEGHGPVVRVTRSPELEARASIACDKHGRLWVAYDVGGENWGKDTGFWLELGGAPQGARLYETRSVGVSIVNALSGEVSWPGSETVELASLNSTLHEHVEYPELFADSTGRMWLLMRRRAALSMSRRGVGRQFTWELVVSRFDTDTRGWTEPRLVADSACRLDAHASLADAGRHIWLAWPCDHREIKAARPDACSIFAGTLDLVGVPEADVSQAPLVAAAPPTAASAPPLDVGEAEAIARLRAHTIDAAGPTLHVYRGDLHRHTENSTDGGGDGSLLDAYRYAIDAAGMDFLLVTDHNDGQSEYNWWLREKLNDVFRVGQSFVGLFGYERSVGYPNGHRNVFFPERGVRPLDIARQETGRAPTGSGELLYPYLRQYGGICFSHTSGTNMGTDWRDNDPLLEPLVEIFQGDRTNYEKLGAPWAADPDQTATHEGGFQPLGYVDNALLNKGYKLGFHASSDHLSTHLSYACIIAESNTRAALREAMIARHAYAANDNILLDVRSSGTGGTYIMGDVFTTAGPPTIDVQVVGTAPLQEVVVIRNDVVVYAVQSETPDASFSFTDMNAPTGQENYYYVRVLQTDRRLAWASPMWITVEE